MPDEFKADSVRAVRPGCGNWEASSGRPQRTLRFSCQESLAWFNDSPCSSEGCCYWPRDDASYLITSEWSEEQAFLDFIHSQAFRDVTNWGKEQILSGRPQHKIYKH